MTTHFTDTWWETNIKESCSKTGSNSDYVFFEEKSDQKLCCVVIQQQRTLGLVQTVLNFEKCCPNTVLIFEKEII